MQAYCEKVVHSLYDFGATFTYQKINEKDVTFTDIDTGFSVTFDIPFCIDTNIDPYQLAHEIIMEFDYFDDV